MPRKPQQKGDHYYDPFPTRLRELIEERGLVQEDLTGILGVKSRQSVTGYIDGSTAPTADKIAAIAKAYGVAADWLLGLWDIPSPDMDLQAVCRYTGLSEDAISVLKLGETVPRALNLLAEKPQWAGDDWNVFKSPLWQLCAALAKLERAAIPAAVEALNNDPTGEYFDAAQKKESLELELFRFEKACREIPALYIDGLSDQTYVTGQGGVGRFPNLHYMKCRACGVSTARFEAPDMAIAAWNRKADDA